MSLCSVYPLMSRSVLRATFKCAAHFVVPSSENPNPGTITRNDFIMRGLSRRLNLLHGSSIRHAFLKTPSQRAVGFLVFTGRVYSQKRECLSCFPSLITALSSQPPAQQQFSLIGGSHIQVTQMSNNLYFTLHRSPNTYHIFHQYLEWTEVIYGLFLNVLVYLLPQ